MPWHQRNARNTRSGAIFSPFKIALDNAIQVPSRFNVWDALIHENTERITKEDRGELYDEEEEADLEDEDPMDLEDEDYVEEPETTDADKALPKTCNVSGKWDALPNKVRKRKERWKNVRESAPHDQSLPRIKGITAKQRAESTPLATNLQMNKLPVAAPEWTGTHPIPFKDFFHDLSELLGPTFDMMLVDWDGYMPIPILDAEGRVILSLSGQPRGKGWKNGMVGAATSTIRHASQHCMFPDASKGHQHGKFRALAVGVSFGGGQMVCRTHSSQEAQLIRSPATWEPM
ncbi:hypothetical protein Hypma_001550 [Hypsizygus marmoreus]|uniref:Uncharacterized protein n=1 Tax=Hypsizygus marmoreus TaxID=39966 RepID=A0A369KBC6_HYPMA|nr:hypothetical protein Hypma_001550 [Hypsizygus marmoreus]